MLCLIHKNSLGQGEERQNHQTENDLCPFLSVLASGAHLLLWDQDRYGTCFRDWASLCLPLPILLLKLQVRGHSLQKALPRPPNPPQGDAIWAHLGAQHINREWYLWCGNGLFFIQRTAVEMIHAVPQTFPFDLFFSLFQNDSIYVSSTLFHQISFYHAHKILVPLQIHRLFQSSCTLC